MDTNALYSDTGFQIWFLERFVAILRKGTLKHACIGGWYLQWGLENRIWTKNSQVFFVLRVKQHMPRQSNGRLTVLLVCFLSEVVDKRVIWELARWFTGELAYAESSGLIVVIYVKGLRCENLWLGAGDSASYLSQGQDNGVAMGSAVQVRTQFDNTKRQI